MALGIRLLLHPLLGDNRPFLTFLAAVAVAASVGGRGPAIFVSYFVANYFLIPPLGSFYFDHTSINDWANMLVFVALGLSIAEPILAMQRARRRADPILVDGDIVRLNQIFLNILDNAIKYTGRDGAISISTRRQGSDAVVRIRDNGPGIPATMLATVFEMFSQAGATLDHSAGGLGIGLYLVKQLVELHGGTVEAHSDGPGKGSEFVVTFPALAARAAERDVAEVDVAQPVRPTGNLDRHPILNVDDVKESTGELA